MATPPPQTPGRPSRNRLSWNVGPLATVMLLHGYLAARMAPTLDTPAEPE